MAGGAFFGATGAVRGVTSAARVELNTIKSVGCFVAGTPIVRADGSVVAIEQVHAGEWVLSRDAQTGRTAGKRVAKTFVRTVGELVTLHLADAVTGQVVETIVTTSEHPFYVADQGFVPAGQLGIGNVIVTRAGPSLVVDLTPEI